MRRQLRPFYEDDDLYEVYSTQYDHTKWREHCERVRYTASILRQMAPTSIADLSCGDAGIVKTAQLTYMAQLGDITPGWDHRGPLERTIADITPVDVFILSETLEHLRDPDLALRLIRTKVSRLLLTTPIDDEDDDNWEHYWSWNIDDVGEMLGQAGWVGDVHSYRPSGADVVHTYQVWRCV